MKFSLCMKEIRESKGITQRQLAKELDVSPNTYIQFESVPRKYNSTIPQAIIRTPEIFTKQEYDKIQASFRCKMKKEDGGLEERRIRNIPNFYRDLNALGDLRRLDVNDPRVQEIRVKLGGKKVWEGEYIR